MKATIEKFIKGYEKQIAICERRIDTDNIERRRLNRATPCSAEDANRNEWLLDDIISDTKIENAKRSAYVQAKADLQTLLELI